mmetsp:Transcript_1263/g.2833  ORF Transcript_1263/g.2833 Transcript_1263/m.2833 type:complete len:245 (-) Transcript_1263:482-1216(-)|eukprot:CAMPEP_0177709134 /NCGR_PEP_ID=MMETSP0484_2-20121128/10641_1 /TAXON_ID=354590 /ORGANISM="Rhodomonas lens, Strain RHODO" /LENGTH=244 /DNA_ID=CAMNT_0019220731 /DNA_START=11 /DNA_END=745 /DNA_ORIENTATION=+
MTSVEKERPLRILCLHGHAQSAASMHNKTGSVRSFCSKGGLSEWVYIDAPFEVPACTHSVETGKEGPAFTWMPSELSAEGENWEWFSRTALNFGSELSEPGNATMERVAKVWHSQGPFDGIFGFSRGGAVATAVAVRSCAATSDGPNFQLPGLRFLVLCAAYTPLDSLSRRFLEGGYCKKLPTLHIIGQTDQIVTAERSQDLVRHFSDPESSESAIWAHPGGHFVPSQCRKALREFLMSIPRGP